MKKLILALLLVFILTACDFDVPIEEVPEYDITYYVDGVEYQKDTYQIGEVILPPSNPTKEDHTFMGWYVDDEGVNQFGFGAMPNGDVIVYSSFIEIINDEVILEDYEIMYESNGGNSFTKDTVTSGDMFFPTNQPTKEGYTFMGWYVDEDLLYQVPFNLVVYNDMTFYAKWELVELTVKFYIHDNLVYLNYFKYGTELPTSIVPDIPDYHGHNTIGWDNEVPDTITEDLEFYAVYEPRLYYLSYLNPILNTVNGIAPGDDLTVVTTEEGVIYGFGLFDGSSLDFPLLNEQFNLLENENIVKMDSEKDHKVFITNMNRVFIMSDNSTTPFLGEGFSKNMLVKEITSIFDTLVGENVIDIQISESNLFALTDLGNLYVMGSNDDATAGIVVSEVLTTPTLVDLSSILNVSEVVTELYVGPVNVSVVTSEERLISWGYGIWGNIGNGDSQDETFPVVVPLTVPMGESIIKVEHAYNHSIVLLSDGTVYGAGLSVNSEISNLNTVYLDYFEINQDFIINGISGTVIDVFVGNEFTLLMFDDGEILGRGVNDDGQLCDGTFSAEDYKASTFESSTLAVGEGISQIIINNHSGYMISTKGKLYGWGDNENNELIFANISDQYDLFDLTIAIPQFYTNYQMEEVEFGSLITHPVPPVKEGYTFIGWFVSVDEFTNIEFTDTTMPAQHLNLIPMYEENTE